MPGKYSRLRTSDPDDSVAIEFDSIFDYTSDKENVAKSESAFDYGAPLGSAESKAIYKSAFTYSTGFDPDKKNIESIEIAEPSTLCKVCASLMTVMCYIVIGLTFPITACFFLKNVQAYERLVIFRLGRFVAAKGPGLVLVLPCIDSSTRVDLRMKAFSIPPQKGLTQDGATIEVGAEVYYRVKDATLSVNNVQDLNRSTRVIAETILQKHFCKYQLSDINMNKAPISQSLITDINQMTLPWGVEVTRATLSQVTVITGPNPLVQQGSNPLSFLGPLLFPSGQSNMPLEQLQGLSGFSPDNQSQQLEMPTDPSDVSSPMLAQVKQDQLQDLQKQYPHLKNELCRLMKVEGKPEDAVGASGPLPTQGRILRYKSPRDLLKAVVPKLNSQLVEEFMCIYKFIVIGPGGGTFYLDLKNHEGDADEGEPRMGTADVTLTLTMEDLDSLLTGQTNAFSAYMTGKIEVEGDMGLASKLGDIVELLK